MQGSYRLFGLMAVNCASFYFFSAQEASSQIIDRVPVQVTSTNTETVLVSSLGPVGVASGYQPLLRNPRIGREVPAIAGTVWASIPAGTAVGDVDYYIRPIGGPVWGVCQFKKGIDPADGFPIQYQVCGTYPDVHFVIGTANFSCANIASDDRFLRVAFTTQHYSRDTGFEFKAVIHHKQCGSNGTFKSN